MKVFHCDHCQQLVFFENTLCVKCEHPLAYVPELDDVVALDPAGGNAWAPAAPARPKKLYRLCQNYHVEQLCNWTVLGDDPNPYCRSCRLTRVIPGLDVPGHREDWRRLEIAKRRLVYTLLHLRLPTLSKTEDPQRGLAFEFLADAAGAKEPTPVLTGHNEGVITINVAEADDAEREKRRRLMHEPYRTLLGHFRHESGHYYWDRLIANTRWIEEFRGLFGDERADYAQALERHYQTGPPADWPSRFVSAYASAHAWEDWAESWAHYLHMIDTLETAAGSGLSLSPLRVDEPALEPTTVQIDGQDASFQSMLSAWFALTYLLNNLNRGLGLPDGYPFVLPPVAIDKLRFVHKVVGPTKSV